MKTKKVGMTNYKVGKRGIVMTVVMRTASSTGIGFCIGHLLPDQKRSLGLPVAYDMAIRQDGVRAELVRVTNGYTGYHSEATAV